MRSVLVTRPQPAADEFAEKLRQEGYTAYIAPMMEYVPVTADVSDIGGCQALIFTSVQAVQGFCALTRERTLPVLAVGDVTAAAAEKAGFADVRSAKGDSAAVTALVKAQAINMGLRKIFHPCSADTPDDIAAAVAGSGVEIVNRPVYKAVLVENIPDSVVAALQKGVIDAVLLFSPRTAENFVRLLGEKGLSDASRSLEAICISDPVARVLRAQPWRALKVAAQPNRAAMFKALHEQTAEPERRARVDRRIKPAYHNADGHVEAESYTGPERRLRARRAHEQMQKKRIMQEKMRFLNRSVLTFAFMFIAIVIAGVLVMAPEYARIGHARPPPSAASQPPGQSFGQSLGEWVRKVVNSVTGDSEVTEDVDNLAAATENLVMNPASGDFSQVLSNFSLLRQHLGGAAEQSVAGLRQALLSPDVRNGDDVGRAIDSARRNDPSLDGMFGNVRKEDVEAGAMLLLLNEFRSDVSGGRPYTDDLALMKKFAGNDPRMNAALQRLAPYAASGVMNRQALQTEFQGLAGDIVMSELKGQDISMQDAAQKRLARLERAGNLNEVTGEDPSAVVARAQIMLDQGNVQGATAELQKLNGNGAAQPWIDNANGYMAAEGASGDVEQGMLQGIAGAGASSVQDLMDAIRGALPGARNGSGIVAP